MCGCDWFVFLVEKVEKWEKCIDNGIEIVDVSIKGSYVLSVGSVVNLFNFGFYFFFWCLLFL